MLPCYSCKHSRKVPGNCHISCSKPCAQPVTDSSTYGLKSGWFFYPMLFDPVWGSDTCSNFEEKAS